MNDNVYVWDPLVRFFHWTLVLAFIIAYFSGDEANTLHIYSGYYILGLVLFRVSWGFVGSRHARFGDFIASPAAVLDYLNGFIAKGSGKEYLGHNPAGGWMVIALLVSLILSGISGLKIYGLEGHGPLAENTPNTHVLQNPGLLTVSSDEKQDHDENEKEEEDDERDDDEGEEFWEEIHEFFANFTVLLVFLHIGGVVASSLKQGQNLVRSMISGYKQQ